MWTGTSLSTRLAESSSADGTRAGLFSRWVLSWTTRCIFYYPPARLGPFRRSMTSFVEPLTRVWWNACNREHFTLVGDLQRRLHTGCTRRHRNVSHVPPARERVSFGWFNELDLLCRHTWQARTGYLRPSKELAADFPSPEGIVFV